jgi:hypothetical protein
MERTTYLAGVATLGALLLFAGKSVQAAAGNSEDAITVPNGLADSAVETPRSLAEIQAAQQNSKATLRAGVDSTPEYNGAPETRHLLSRSWSVTGSAPLGTGSDPTQVATLDGLADAAQVAAKAQWVYGKDRNATAEEKAPYQNKIKEAIAIKNTDLAARSAADQASELARLKTAGCKVEKNQVVFNPGTNSADCLLSKDDANMYREVLLGKDRTLLIPGFSATVGTKSYKFLDALSDKNMTSNKTPWSAQAFLGYHFFESLITVGYHYDAAYKDADQGTLCPMPAGPLTTCKTGPLGAPPRKEQSVPFIEYRHRLPDNWTQIPILKSLAFAPIVSYDIRASVLGISVPVYFVPDATGKLTGGLSVGWRSDQGGLQVGVIVSTAFSAFPAG